MQKIARFVFSASIALVFVVGASCSTDVIYFASKQELLCNEPPDGGKDCRNCWWGSQPGSTCQLCGPIDKPSYDTCHADGGIKPRLVCKLPIKTCKLCYWSDKVAEQCKICWDGQGVIFDSCGSR